MTVTYTQEGNELIFPATTDIQDAVRVALVKCLKEGTKVFFIFNEITVTLDYAVIFRSIVSNTVDDYTRHLMQNRRNKE